MQEKRHHKRIRVNIRVAYRDNDFVYKMGRVCDICKGGMYIRTGSAPAVDGYVFASLDVEEFGKVVWVQGDVVWKTDNGMGVKFSNTDEKGLNNILNYRSIPFG